jgi:hypothetical protein
MVAKAIRLAGVATLALAAQLLVASPAFAADEAANTGLLAALGVEAAGGNTELGGNGGQIEGWLLTSRYLDAVAVRILERTAAAGGGRRILLLAGDEPINLGLPSALSRRIALLKQRIAAYAVRTACTARIAEAEKTAEQRSLISPTLADLGGALRTDTKIDGFDIPLEDRALISAIGKVNGGNARLDLRIPSDATMVPEGGIVTAWDSLADAAASLGCAGRDDDAGKALKAQYDALDAYVNKPGEDGASSPLERAAALGDLAIGQPPLLLRVGVEKAGGTTIVRSNIFLKLGFPGAVMLSGGIVASYRLIDPVNGVLKSSGLVQCALPPVEFGSVAARLRTPPDPRACNF